MDCVRDQSTYPFGGMSGCRPRLSVLHTPLLSAPSLSLEIEGFHARRVLGSWWLFFSLCCTFTFSVTDAVGCMSGVLVFLDACGWRFGVSILVPEYIWDGAINLLCFGIDNGS